MLEKEYDKEKELLEFALEETNDGWWDWLVKENKFYLSPRYWEAFGYDPKTKSHLPEEWQEICHPEDLEKVQEVLKKHFDSRGKVPYLTEVRFKHSQGHWITVICRGKTVEWDEDWNPIRFVGVHTDMTRYKEQEAKLVRANTELEQFAYRTSHDLKGPLLSIKGLTKFIEMDLEKGELDEVKENIRKYQDFQVR